MRNMQKRFKNDKIAFVPSSGRHFDLHIYFIILTELLILKNKL